MRSADRSTRREFVRLTGLAAGAAGLAVPLATRAFGQVKSGRAPDDVLARLLEGNKRFVNGQLTHPGRSPKDFSALAEGQAPLAIIIA
jgi:carbonic anhydrase